MERRRSRFILVMVLSGLAWHVLTDAVQAEEWVQIQKLGAGDAYAAGLLYGLTNGCSLERSGQIASLYSARVVSQMGPRYSGNIREEVQGFA